MTFYLGVVDRAADGGCGVWFPDLPGCTSAAASLDELFGRAIEAVRLWAEDAMADGEALPRPRGTDALLQDPDVAAAMKAAAPEGSLVQIPLLLAAGRSVRANISIEADLLNAIDAAAAQRKLTRSAFLASAARAMIARGE